MFSFFNRRKQPGKQAQKSYWYLIQVCKNWSRNCSGFSKRPMAGCSNIPSPQSESLGNPKLKDVLLGLYHHNLARIKHSEIDFCVSGKSSGKRILYVVLFEPRAHTRNSFILLFQTTFRLKNASFTTRYCKKWFFVFGFFYGLYNMKHLVSLLLAFSNFLSPVGILLPHLNELIMRSPGRENTQTKPQLSEYFYFKFSREI